MGFTRFDNDLFDALITCQLSGQEFRLALAVLRQTLGWNKEEECIDIHCFIRITGDTIRRGSVYKHLRNLLARRIVCIRLDTEGRKVYSIQLDTSKWNCREMATKSPTGHKRVSYRTQNSDPSILYKDKEKDITPIVPLKQTVSKKRPPKNPYPEDFMEFWTKYPLKRSKAKALKAWQKLNGERPDDLLEILERHKEQDQWIKDGGDFIPHPATWLNGRRWEDVIETEEDRRADAKRRFLARPD